MPLTITTGPTSEPLTLAEAKGHLIVDWIDDDELIDEFIASARSAIETFLSGPLLPTVYRYTLDGFPPVINLPVGPILAAGNVAIDFVDSAGASQTLATADYQVSTGEIPRIVPSYGKTWPQIRGQMDAVTITFTAGYAAATDIPPAILQALRLSLGAFYEKREAGDLPVGARNLLIPFVRWN